METIGVLNSARNKFCGRTGRMENNGIHLGIAWLVNTNIDDSLWSKEECKKVDKRGSSHLHFQSKKQPELNGIMHS